MVGKKRKSDAFTSPIQINIQEKTKKHDDHVSRLRHPRKERNSNQKYAEQRVTVDMEECMILFDFLSNRDAFLSRSINMVDSRAIKDGARVLHAFSGEPVGSLEDIRVLEHPQEDLRKIISYWRVMGMCPYFLMRDRHSKHLFVRIPKPSPLMDIEICTDAYGERGIFRSMPGYQNPSLDEISKASTGMDQTHVDKPSNPEKRSVVIVDSGVFLWQDRIILPQSETGGKVITPLRDIYEKWKLKKVRQVVHVNVQRSLAQTHIWTSQDQTPASFRKNNLGGNIGEQQPIGELLEGMQDRYDEAEDVDARKADGNDDEIWTGLFFSHFFDQHRFSSAPTVDDIPSFTCVQPSVHHLKENERVAGMMQASSNVDLSKIETDYRTDVSSYAGQRTENHGLTIPDVRIQGEKIKNSLDEIRKVVSDFWEYAYAIVFADKEKATILDTVMRDPTRDSLSEEEHEFLRRRSFVKVHFLKLPDIQSMKELMGPYEAGAIEDEEAILILRNYLGLPPFVSGKRTINRMMLSSEVEKRKLKLEETRIEIEKEKVKNQSQLETQKMTLLKAQSSTAPSIKS